ncbi:Pentatricopeptide repeat-containing protein [Ananas comosus]|uniref:Pentatricopeptide repeat-containing protein n=1 Tax=Ananas comosus TaxID=4615 RepID=A0A199VPS9_ANACO|nr:Pentatricopeptide repeat-containing protein [Ananas comosus]
MDDARKLFDEMPERNLIAWTVLMSGYSLHGPAFEAVSLFRDMLRRQPPLRPDPFVFSVVLRACSLAGSLNHGRELHCMILKLFYIEDLFVANGLVSIYANCGSITYSELVFLRIRRPDLVSWTSMLSGYMKNGLDDDALELFNDMAWRGSRFDAFALSVSLKASSNLGCVRSGIQIHCVMIKMGFTSCLFLQNCVIEFYGRIGELVAMKQVFDKLDGKDLVSWNTVIECYAYNCCHGQALSLFRILMDEDLICDRFTLVSILQAVAGLGAVDHGKEIHGYLIRTGFASDTHVISALLDMYIEFGSLNDECNVVPLKLFTHFLSTGAKVDEFIFASTLKHCAVRLDLETGRLIHACVAKLGMDSDAHVVSSLIDMYSKCGILDSSYCLFSRIEHPDVVTWSSIISGSCSNGQFEKGLQLFRSMQLDYIRANEFTYTSALKACIASRDIRRGAEIHCNLIRNGYLSNLSVMKTLINLYLEVSQIDRALSLCSLIPQNENSWNQFIQAFAKLNNHKGILELFHRIQCSNGQLDHSLAHLVLDSCGNLLLLNMGLQAHAYITKRGFASNHKVGNALIKMYSDFGILSHAIDAFNQMPEKSSSSWAAIIAANVDNGCPSKALELFIQMVRKDKSPNSNTFVSVLKACAQKGLIDEAFHLFVLMRKVYQIDPSAEHYYSMVEVLGRVGMFREAEHFIERVIPCESGTAAWKALLSSGLVHGNTNVAKTRHGRF